MTIIRFGITALLVTLAWPATAQGPVPAQTPLAPVAPSPPFEVFVPVPPVPPVFFDLQREGREGRGPTPKPGPYVGVTPSGRNEDAIYEQARALIEQNRYDRALDRLDSVIAIRGNRADAAMYWKAYSLSKVSRAAEALATLADLQKTYASSRWLRDARALEVELRQASGQPLNADAQSDDELKLLALRGLMQSDPSTALPVIEKMLAGNSSVRVKDRALFVISQDNSARAREVLVGIAKGSSNPDLQSRAIRYLGMRGADSRQVLDEVYRATSDATIKREIMRSLMIAGGRDRLLALAKSETSPELRGEAVQQLGVMGAANELDELYRSESSPAVKKRILQAMFVGGNVDKLAALAKSEPDVDLRRTAIRNVGLANRPGTADLLKSLYTGESSVEIKRSVIEALFLQNNATTLVELARAEKSPELKRAIVEKLSVMNQSSEARAYMLELLK